MQFYRITDRYLNFLRGIDNKIHPNYPHISKPHVGVIININSHQYFAPLSSYKPKHDKIKNHSIYKIYGDTNKKEKLSVIHLNNMFPIIQTEIERIDFSLEEAKYKTLLEKEYSYIISHQEDIRKKAFQLYNDVINKKTFFKNISCDFEKLEKQYITFSPE